MRLLALLLALSATPAVAQSFVTRGTPGGGVTAFTTSDAVLIPASTRALSFRYQAQGTGFACVSWVVGTVTITGTDATAKCSAGAFLMTASSSESRTFPSPVPNSPLHGVAATGASLQLIWEAN